MWIVEEVCLEVEGGCYLVVEVVLVVKGECFVVNDCCLFFDDWLWLVGGFNMGGKFIFLW